MFQLAANPCTLLGWWPRASFFWSFDPSLQLVVAPLLDTFEDLPMDSIMASWSTRRSSTCGCDGACRSFPILKPHRKRQLKDSVGAQSPRARSGLCQPLGPSAGALFLEPDVMWDFNPRLPTGQGCTNSRPKIKKCCWLQMGCCASCLWSVGLFSWLADIKDEIEKGCDEREDEWRQRRTLNGPNTWYRSSRLVWRLGGVAACQLIRRKKNVEPNLNQWTRGSKQATRPCSLAPIYECLSASQLWIVLSNLCDLTCDFPLRASLLPDNLRLRIWVD